jgi:hypothetical protein
MFEGSALLRLAVVALLALSGAAANANPPPPDDADSEEDGEKSGGNAVDNAAANPAPGGAPQAASAGLTPRAYAEMAEFWGLFLTSGNPFLAAYGTPRGGDEDLSAPPSLQLQTAPIDGPAESILDDIDDGPILLVGAPGNSYAQPAAQPGAEPGATTTPPPESILDFLDEASPTPPAPAAAGPASSALNQAQRPQAVEKAP